MKRYPFFRLRGMPAWADAHTHFIVMGMMLRELGSALDGFEEAERSKSDGAPLDLEPQGFVVQGAMQDRAYWSTRKMGHARNAVFAVFEIGQVVKRMKKIDERVAPAYRLFEELFPTLRSVRNSLMHLHERAYLPLPQPELRSGQDDYFPDIADQASAWGVDQSGSISIRIEVLNSPGGTTVQFAIGQHLLDAVERVLGEVSSAIGDSAQPLVKW